MQQLDLFDTPPPDGTLTVANIDEWTAQIADSFFVPADWTRAALADLLGEDIPNRVWPSGELRELLRRAREAAAAREREG